MIRQKTIALIAGSVVLLLLIMLLIASIMSPGQKFLGIKLPTSIITPGKFSLVYEDSYYVKDGKTLSIVFGIKGSNWESEADNVNGFSLTFNNVPDFLSNPTATIASNDWDVQVLKTDSIIYLGAKDLKSENPLTKDTATVLTLNFNVNDPDDDELIFDADIVYGNSYNQQSILSNNNKIKLTTQVDGEFSLIVPDQMTISSNSEFTIPIGVKGAQNVDSKKVNALSVDFSGFPDYVTECSATGKVSNWSAYVGDLSGGKIRMTATGSGNPLTANESNLIDLTCSTSKVSSGSKTVSLAGELTTYEKSEKFTLPVETVDLVSGGTALYSITGTISGDTEEGVTLTCGSLNATSDSGGKFTIKSVADKTSCTLTPAKSGYTFLPVSRAVTVNGANVTGQTFVATKTSTSGSSYSITGTITGDTASGVLVLCGSYSGVSNSAGKFTIENVPAGTSCSLIANKSGYTFSPETIAVSNISSNLTGYDFNSSAIRGEKGEKGDTGDDGEDGDDGKVIYTAPKSGPAENIIIGAAVFLGLIGSIVFVGAKLKWFA